MNLSVGIVGLPNVGPIQSLPSSEVYVLASKGRLYGAALPFSFSHVLFQKGVSWAYR